MLQYDPKGCRVTVGERGIMRDKYLVSTPGVKDDIVMTESNAE